MSAKFENIDLEAEAIHIDSGRSVTDSISVEQYEEDLSLQRAIFASLQTTSSSSVPSSVIDLTDLHDDDRVEFVSVHNTSTSSKKRESKRLRNYLDAIGESSSSSSSSNPRISPAQSQSTTFLCEICFDPKPLTDCFAIQGCTHVYCNECMSSYVAAKLQDSLPQIGCPSTGCRRGLLEPHHCRKILPPEVFERWGTILCESVIAGSEKFYCPFKDCSALLIIDDNGGSRSGKKKQTRPVVITQSECPHCYRLFCAQCKCPWHFGIECSEFQKLNETERGREDIMLMNLAKDKKWKRCPSCKMFVEKSAGCMYMKCRCNFAFCYNCGAAFTSNSHICPKCGH